MKNIRIPELSDEAVDTIIQFIYTEVHNNGPQACVDILKFDKVHYLDIAGLRLRLVNDVITSLLYALNICLMQSLIQGHQDRRIIIGKEVAMHLDLFEELYGSLIEYEEMALLTKVLDLLWKNFKHLEKLPAFTTWMSNRGGIATALLTYGRGDSWKLLAR